MEEQLTREETRAIVGPTDDATLAEVLKLGATRSELVEARAWVDNDEAMLNEGRHIPTGRVAQAVAILAAQDEEEPTRGPAP